MAFLKGQIADCRGVLAYSACLQFVDFNKETLKKNLHLLSLWSKVEAMAVWLNTDLCQWGGTSRFRSLLED